SSQAAGPIVVGRPAVLWTSQNLVNPNYLVAPGLTIRQYAYNTRVLGRAYANVPPYVFGYNPYVSTYVYPYNPYLYTYNPYLYPAYSPYAVNVYGPYLGY